MAEVPGGHGTARGPACWVWGVAKTQMTNGGQQPGSRDIELAGPLHARIMRYSKNEISYCNILAWYAMAWTRHFMKVVLDCQYFDTIPFKVTIR